VSPIWTKIYIIIVFKLRTAPRRESQSRLTLITCPFFFFSSLLQQEETLWLKSDPPLYVTGPFRVHADHGGIGEVTMLSFPFLTR
jgi:hypothetical protein